jgi:hypothetical protein
MQTSLIKVCLIFACIMLCSQSFKNAIFYCGFSGDYCGQSKINDVNPNIDTIILAFANTKPDGTVIVD